MTRREAIGLTLGAIASGGAQSIPAQQAPTRPRSVQYYGSENPLPRQIPLRAGPFTLVFEPELAQIRYVRLGEKEVLRAVYAAVRDQNWGTVTPKLSNLKSESTDATFALSFDVSCIDGPIDVLWRGSITGDAQGTIRFDFDAEARSTFLRNRLGFCVLHPVEGCAGEPVAIVHSDGSTKRGVFPELISPHQPFLNIRSIRHAIRPGLDAEVVFAGDVFEMEDHRNWTDASFKTYCTPLALPFPVEVKKGSRIQQSVTVQLHGAAPKIPVRSPSPEVSIEVRPAERTPLPSIGLGVATESPTLSAREARLLRLLRPAHLRIDLPLDRANWNSLLIRASREASALGLPLELAITLGDRADAELSSLAESLKSAKTPVARYLIFSRKEKSTTAATMDRARGLLKGVDPGARLVSGTDAYFTELNRERPPAGRSDGVCYSVNPQVHAFDNTSLVETLPMQAATVRAARSFCGSVPIAVTPITLKPRSNPNATVAPSGTKAAALPDTVDPRQMSLFAGAWTLGSMKYLAEAAAASLTYYETTGWRGVMEIEKGSALPALFPSRPSEVFPVFHVLADVGEFAGGEVVRTLSSDPLRAESLLLRKGGRTRVLIANLSPQLQQVRIAGLALGKAIRSVQLDEHSVSGAMGDPERYRGQAGGLRELGADGVLTVSLLPYGIARIDSV